MSIALAAVLGLAYFGFSMNTENESNVAVSTTTRIEKETADYNFGDVYDVQQRMISQNTINHKREMVTFTDQAQDSNRVVGGQPVYDLSQREFVSNKMNNLNPNPWNKVGPGIGVGPNVPAYGGKQQLFRVLPVNMNESRLTQLPGRLRAPPTAVAPQGESRPVISKNRPDKVFENPFMSSQSLAVKTAPPTRPDDIRGQRLTKKDHSLVRTDDLEVGGPIFNLGMAHTVTANTMKDTNRINPDRAGNPGRMNVTDGPLATNGMITSVRIDANEFRVNHGALPMGYIREGQQEANQYKGNPGPSSLYPLDLAKKQLVNNPFNHIIN